LRRWKLLGATASGGILAPLCLAYGIQKGTAFEVSLLLNLESVTTTVIAWLVFYEHVGKNVWLGKTLLVLGGVVISVIPSNHMGISTSSLLVIGACVFWGIDNNLTRDLEEVSPTVIASVKGLVAGVFNVGLALSLSVGEASIAELTGVMFIGAMSYGVSLILFIEALRLIGASRTSSYFAVGPFFGMFFAVVLAGDRPENYQWGAVLLMAVGLWVLFKERHEHWHQHNSMTHQHKHIHDEHHRHLHSADVDSKLEPHDHIHNHNVFGHSHAHFPDTHHRHRH